jgi:hypothetical protein
MRQAIVQAGDDIEATVASPSESDRNSMTSQTASAITSAARIAVDTVNDCFVISVPSFT